jgi:hypothetical protein
VVVAVVVVAVVVVVVMRKSIRKEALFLLTVRKAFQTGRLQPGLGHYLLEPGVVRCGCVALVPLPDVVDVQTVNSLGTE